MESDALVVERGSDLFVEVTVPVYHGAKGDQPYYRQCQ